MSRPDDAIVAVYGLIAIAIVWYFRDVLREAHHALRLFGASVLTLILASILDLIGVHWLEEPVEVVASMLGPLGFGALALHHLIAAGVVVRPQAEPSATRPPDDVPAWDSPTSARPTSSVP